MNLPLLGAAIRQRFVVTNAGAVETEPAPDHVLMRALVSREQFAVNQLSNVGKLSNEGNPVVGWRYEMPPQPITALLVSRYKVPGIADRDAFPYSLKAVGPVSAAVVMRGGKGLLTENVVLVP